jgi:hypothetical protein
MRLARIGHRGDERGKLVSDHLEVNGRVRVIGREFIFIEQRSTKRTNPSGGANTPTQLFKAR